MKQALRNLAAILCLLMLGLGSASCMSMASRSQPSCGQCARHQPPHHQNPSCCETHRQPSVTAAAVSLEPPTQLSAADSLSTASPLAHTLELTTAQHIWPPPLLPRLNLRI